MRKSFEITKMCNDRSQEGLGLNLGMEIPRLPNRCLVAFAICLACFLAKLNLPSEAPKQP